MTTETTKAARYERFGLAYPSGAVVDAYYCDGATLGEVSVPVCGDPTIDRACPSSFFLHADSLQSPVLLPH
jgi:hypothetical protein